MSMTLLELRSDVRILALLGLLLRRQDGAQRPGNRDPGLPVPLEDCRKIGVADAVLGGWIEDGLLASVPGGGNGNGTAGEPTNPVTEGVMLTAKGAAWATEAVSLPGEVPGGGGKGASRKRPSWHAGDRALYFGGRLVLHYAREAPSEMAVLRAFEARHWEECIEVPAELRRGRGRGWMERLRQTLKNIHLHLYVPCLRFQVQRAEGTMSWAARRVTAAGQQAGKSRAKRPRKGTPDRNCP